MPLVEPKKGQTTRSRLNLSAEAEIWLEGLDRLLELRAVGAIATGKGLAL